MELELKLQTLSKILGDRIRVNINNLRDRFSGLSDLTRKPLIKEKQIFFELFIDEDIEEELKKSMLEQLEIAVQVLINKGYKIGVFNSQEKDREICKKFVDVFKTEEIKYLGNIKENLQILTLLYESEFSIVMSQEFLLYCLVVEKPCISIFINKDLLELVQQKNTCINKENFNAGVLLEKVKYIKENNNAIKKNMSNLFNHCTEERLRANDELVDNKSQSYSLQKEVNIEDRSCVMEDYKKQFKENIHSLIEKGLLVEAKDMITQYEQIVKDDVDIYSIKGVIAMIEGDLEESEEVLKEGLNINQSNFDILYNLAYLYQSKGQEKLAILYYKGAFRNAKDIKDEDQVYEILQGLGVKQDRETIIEDALGDKYYTKAFNFERMGNQSDAALNYGLAYRYSNDNNLKPHISEKYNDNEVLKNIFNVVATNKQKRFIILSSCGWQGIYQRMHHIARSLAKFGHDVMYITPSASANIDNNDISISDLTQYSFNQMKEVDNVKIYMPISAMCGQKQIANNYIDLVQKLLDLDTHKKTVIITYLPYQVNVLNALNGKFIHIYECVDDHSDLEYAFWGNQKDILWEQELMDRADAITTTATSLFLQRIAIEGRENVYLSRNAVNESDFIFERGEIPEDLKNIPEPRIVYTGVVYQRYDEKLFYDVVESNPDKSFVIIGSIHDGMLTKKYNNLYLLGPKNHSELKNYLQHMQVGIVPYIDTADMDIACDSIKQYEYLACGLPVITTFMPESSIDKVYTFLANTKDSFNEAIEKCLNLKTNKSDISNFLAKNSWNARAALLCRLSDNEVSRKEQEKMIRYIGEELDRISMEYGSPIFQTLKAVYANLENTYKFEKMVQKLYRKHKKKYIERQYLIALLQNKKINDSIEVVLNSQYIKEELKQELSFCKTRNDIKSMECLLYMCIGNFREALDLIDEINDQDIKLIYLIYINYILGEDITYRSLNLISNKNQKSPLLKFLMQINETKKNNKNIKQTNIFISDMFNNISRDVVKTLTLNGMDIEGFCTMEAGLKDEFKNIELKKVVEMQNNSIVKIIVPYNSDYIQQVRILAENGIKECEVAIISDDKITLINIDKDLMKRIKEKEYNRTVTFNKFNAADSNIYALIKYMPEEYQKKYKLNIIYGRDVWTIENIVKVPLISNVTVSGFATFLYNYPKFTYNIDVGHNGVSLKACGMMDKKEKNSGGNQALYEKADCICVASNFHKIVNSSFFAIPENKYRITGLPRNDLLILGDSKLKLERLLGISLKNKTIIFNMPTFHRFDQVDRIEGSSTLNDSVKIQDFDYEKFNEFLEEHNLICVSKVHHGEEISVTLKTKNRSYKNIWFINNDDLDKNNLDLYEILGAGDILITDYSTVYNDFLFMNKPIIFANPDIEQYRENRGLALEPYDFWTAGPKVRTQQALEKEILKCKLNKNYFKKERERLFPVFFEYHDNKAVQRTWNVIDRSLIKNMI